MSARAPGGMAGGQGSAEARGKGVLGWREWVALPELGLTAIRAKVDTGARTSCLHVESSETFWRGDAEWVRFQLRPERDAEAVPAEALIVDRRDVTDSSGHRSLRVFIRTSLVVRGQQYPIELNLTNRLQMLFPMLLGRTALIGRWMVDPSRSFTAPGPGEHVPPSGASG